MTGFSEHVLGLSSRLPSRLTSRIGSFGLAVVAAVAMSAAAPRAHAASLIGPASAPAAQGAVKFTTEIQYRGGGGFRGGMGGGGFRGGGFRGGPAFGGGGFRGGGMAFRGGGFRGGGMAFRGGGFRGGPVYRGAGFYRGGPAFRGPAFRGGGFRYAAAPIYRHRGYAPARYYGYQRRYVRPRAYGYAPVYYGRRFVQPRRFCHTVWGYYGPQRICRPPYYASYYPGVRFNPYW
jgi:hypothetical protein